jgi:hypothetical protein
MARAKQASKRTTRRTTLPVVGAAGVSLAMAGGASATAPADAPSQDAARPVVFLSEEEISDVSLGTFYVFDKEYVQPGEILKFARGCGGCGCRGCGGCAVRACGGCGIGCRACRGCGVRACGGCGCLACGGCGCGTCIWTAWGWVLC